MVTRDCPNLVPTLAVDEIAPGATDEVPNPTSISTEAVLPTIEGQVTLTMTPTTPGAILPTATVLTTAPPGILTATSVPGATPTLVTVTAVPTTDPNNPTATVTPEQPPVLTTSTQVPGYPGPVETSTPVPTIDPYP